MAADGHVVRRADAADATALTQILATAFMTDPVSKWVFPVEDDRAGLHPDFFRTFVDLAFADGEVYTTTDRAGVALWLNVDVTAPTEPDDAVNQRLANVCGQYTERFFMLADRMDESHPTHESHWYMPFIGVDPDRQNQGVGTALLADRLRHLDEVGAPGYLEASCVRNRQLYARLGFQPLGGSIELTDGAALYPMWRAPA